MDTINKIKGQSVSLSQVPASSGVKFNTFAQIEQLDQLETFVAPCARDQFYDILDEHCTEVRRLSETCSPFQHIRYSPLAGRLLPLLPPDYAGSVWHLIDIVSKRVYAQFF